MSNTGRSAWDENYESLLRQGRSWTVYTLNRVGDWTKSTVVNVDGSAPEPAYDVVLAKDLATRTLVTLQERRRP